MMKTNKKHEENTQNTTESNQEIEDSVATPMSRRTLLKTTIAASAAASLAILGAADSPIQAQTQSKSRDDRALNEYFRRGYNYVDAKLLGGYWNLSVGEAKVNMGLKLLDTRSDNAIVNIRAARGHALERSTVYSEQGNGFVVFPVSYNDMGYQYRDVDALSKYWGHQNVGETKILMNTLLVSGKDKDLQAALKNAKR